MLVPSLQITTAFFVTSIADFFASSLARFHLHLLALVFIWISVKKTFSPMDVIRTDTFIGPSGMNARRSMSIFAWKKILVSGTSNEYEIRFSNCEPKARWRTVFLFFLDIVIDGTKKIWCWISFSSFASKVEAIWKNKQILRHRTN